MFYQEIFSVLMSTSRQSGGNSWKAEKVCASFQIFFFLPSLSSEVVVYPSPFPLLSLGSHFGGSLGPVDLKSVDKILGK